MFVNCSSCQTVSDRRLNKLSIITDDVKLFRLLLLLAAASLKSTLEMELLYKRCGFVAKQKISSDLLNFGFKVFRSF